MRFQSFRDQIDLLHSDDNAKQRFFETWNGVMKPAGSRLAYNTGGGNSIFYWRIILAAILNLIRILQKKNHFQRQMLL